MRSVLVDVASGAESGWHEHPYGHGVIEGSLPLAGVDVRLPADVYRQSPRDYLDALYAGIRAVMRQGDVKPEQVVGIGVDFTSCTILPVFADGSPLSEEDRFRHNPDAWVHLWKDQTAQAEADELTAKALERGEAFLSQYGGKISPSSFFPKVWQVYRRSPEVFEAADLFLEAGDWIVQHLTGEQLHGRSAGGFKALWHGGYPEAFLHDVHPILGRIAREKAGARFAPPGRRAGGLKPDIADALGLRPGTAVAVANIDAHAALPGAGIAESGKMVVVMGTSLCHMVVGDTLEHVAGVSGAVVDGIIPGYVGYEAGQPAVGDMFSWFIDNALPAGYVKAAERAGRTPYEHLERLASAMGPGDSGVYVLDWWNGNRSPLVDGTLSGMIVGLTLQTRPEHLYRGMMEGVAFGSREIIRAFESDGVAVDELYAAGGIAEKSPLMMQIFADVIGRPIHEVHSSSASALGAAVFASVAAGAANGGYDDVPTAVAALTSKPSKTYIPDADRHGLYDRLWMDYARLHRYFGVENPHIMRRLHEGKEKAASPAGDLTRERPGASA